MPCSTGGKVVTRFILVRHGQTEWNREERFRGRADLDLNEIGRSQASAAALHVKTIPVAAIYCSPLKRTYETASIIAEQLNVPVEPLDGLIDIDFGRWQGLSREEAAKQDSELLGKWLKSPQEVRFPGGESLAVVRQRIVAAVEELAARHTDGTVMLVSHMVVCKVLLCAMLGLDNSHYWQVGQDVCAINAFDLTDGVPVVTLINDTCHLKDLARR